MPKFLLRYTIKAAVYYAVLLTFMAISLLPQTPLHSVLVTAVILSAVNTLIRPVLVAIALPFNIITFGIASIFANLLTLVIANAIYAGITASGFWVMLLTAFIIMLADDTIRVLRKPIKTKRIAE
ncbi:MAG: phage holin family protein [Christensenellales bacterium]|jgi:putative membrane protein